VRDLIAIALKASAARLAGPNVPVTSEHYVKAIEQFRSKDLSDIIADAQDARTIQQVECATFPPPDIICRFKYHVLRRAYAIAIAEVGSHLSREAFCRALPNAFHETCNTEVGQLPAVQEALV
jgi:hypothetical protein